MQKVTYQKVWKQQDGNPDNVDGQQPFNGVKTDDNHHNKRINIHPKGNNQQQKS